jgi:anti-sigma-K factor RskA
MTDRNPDNQHQLFFEALPFYANGTLNAQENGRVQTHLEGCASCRIELARFRDLAATARSGPQWSPSSADWAAMEARMDRAEGRARGAAAARGPWETVRSWFAIAPAPMRWAFAAQAALVIALAGALLFRPGGAKVYETLSSPETIAPSDRARLHLVFAEDATEREIRAVLQDMKAVIVGGPSPTGVYTVELPFAASERGQLEQAIGRARANPKVRFASPPG